MARVVEGLRRQASGTSMAERDGGLGLTFGLDPAPSLTQPSRELPHPHPHITSLAPSPALRHGPSTPGSRAATPKLQINTAPPVTSSPHPPMPVPIPSHSQGGASTSPMQSPHISDLQDHTAPQRPAQCPPSPPSVLPPTHTRSTTPCTAPPPPQSPISPTKPSSAAERIDDSSTLTSCQSPGRSLPADSQLLSAPASRSTTPTAPPPSKRAASPAKPSSAREKMDLQSLPPIATLTETVQSEQTE